MSLEAGLVSMSSNFIYHNKSQNSDQGNLPRNTVDDQGGLGHSNLINGDTFDE